ncbi:N-acetylglucosamine-6-phosphate deacetylase [Maribellus sp. CM-23]|uniref:N-acetylglucosamine-6-phosphate deacetylase n=1 Tax=Maribellus sp. CM-23 TaxID=2781026 RepID=UPI001F2A712A|nr:N-acetylglucosamine-6-phosphate deacetylase [Maribellus sp. CM-23]MCE4563448.1 N-acetylglucosamine-6-phosphate deacetylase [Maribellus sp. CM-23]
MKRIKITNGKLITPFRIVENGTLLIENGKIVGTGEGEMSFPGAEEIDAAGNYVSPGFIDMHTHGGGGYDFMDGTPEAFREAARTHVRFGTTALVPTTLTAEKEDLLELLESYKQVKNENFGGAQFLGLHLEGPYFAMSQKGAQDPRYIRNPQRDEYEALLNQSSDIIRWSAAPELEGAMEFGRKLSAKGILAAIAHSDATSEVVAEALENGYTHLTHFYSAMSGVTRRNAFRYAGIIESGYLYDQLTVEIIADGVHLPPSLLQLIYKQMGPARIALITDSMRAAGQEVDESILGSKKDGLPVLVEDGVAKLPDRTAFAGSVATADRLVRNMIQLAGVPLLHAIQMISSTPARICGVEKQKGSLTIGKDADVVIFDPDIQVLATLVKGDVMHSKL